MSDSAFNLLSSGISFKNLKDNEKKLFTKKGKTQLTSNKERHEKEALAAIDLFNYNRAAETTIPKHNNPNPKKGKLTASQGNCCNNGITEGTNLENEQHTELKTEEQIAEFRSHMRISVSGGDIPPPITSFQMIPFQSYQDQLKRIVLSNIEEFKFKEPTPIQMQSIPVVMQNRDLLGIAPTGSGKTAAYLIPLIAELNFHEDEFIRAIILTPTVELAYQVDRHFARLIKGRNFKHIVLTKNTVSKVTDQFRHVDLVISTPLTLISTITTEKIDFTKVEILVLDEGDKLFEDTFIEQTDTIFEACSNSRLQRLLFSATLPQHVEEMAKTILRDPIKVVIGTKNSSNSNVSQSLVYCGKEDGKLIALRNILQTGFEPPLLIFVQSKERAKQLYSELAYDKFSVDVIHSDLSKEARTAVINRFRSGESWILIATDMLGRGLDFLGLNMVINYDFPQSGIDYIHRIGRTGRAGRKGRGITLFTEDDKPLLRSIANVMKISGCDVPEWMLELKKTRRSERKKLERKPIKRDTISTQARFAKLKEKQGRKKAKKDRKDSEEEEMIAPGEDLSLLL